MDGETAPFVEDVRGREAEGERGMPAEAGKPKQAPTQSENHTPSNTHTPKTLTKTSTDYEQIPSPPNTQQQRERARVRATGADKQAGHPKQPKHSLDNITQADILTSCISPYVISIAST